MTTFSVYLKIWPLFFWLSFQVHGAHSSQLRPAISMVTCTLLGSIQHRNDIKERMVSILVPHLVAGLRSKCVEYTASSYMILSQLCSQTLLKEKVLESLLPVITKVSEVTHLNGLSYVCMVTLVMVINIEWNAILIFVKIYLCFLL